MLAWEVDILSCFWTNSRSQIQVTSHAKRWFLHSSRRVSKSFQSKKLNWDWLAALNTEWFGKAFGGQKCIDNDSYVIPKFGYDLEVSSR